MNGTKKKIVAVLRKLLIILQKNTGERYDLIGIPETYRNSWGRFLGYYVVSSKKKVFRFNIRLDKADQAQIISVDRWKTGFENKPISTMSCEGFGISKIFFSLVDFVSIINPVNTLNQIGESVIIKEEKWTPQPEKVGTAFNLIGISANFLGENHSWAAAVKSGNFDTAALAKALKKYFIDKGVPIAGYGTNRLLKPLRKAIEVFDDLGGDSAASNIPVSKVFKGIPETPVKTQAPPPVAAAFQNLINAITSREDPDTIINDYKQTITDMLTVSDYPFRGACAFGLGGTGKSYHWKEIVKQLGLTEGIGYKEIGGKSAKDIQQLQEVLYNTRNVPLVIFDDCDDIFSSPDRRNIMKQAMQDDGACKIFVSEKISDEETGEKVPTGAYEINSHYVFVTNKDPREQEQALKRRIACFCFDFNTEEMSKIIRSNFSHAAPEFDVSNDEKEYILQCMTATIGYQGGLKEIEFGTFNKI